MASFIKVFVKNLTKKVSHLNKKIQDSFQHVCLLLHYHVFLCLKFYVLFCFCHDSLFNVSLLYLFINVFTRYLSKTWWERCHILTQNSNIQFNMYASPCVFVFNFYVLIYTYNKFHNILRLFDVLPNFPFTTSETMRDYYL